MTQSSDTTNALLDALKAHYTKKYSVIVDYNKQGISVREWSHAGVVHIAIHQNGKCVVLAKHLSWTYSETLEIYDPDFMGSLDHSVEHLFNTVKNLNRKSKPITDISTKTIRE